MGDIVTNGQQPGAVQSVVGLFEKILPTYLDYKYGRDPNTFYGLDATQQGYLFSPNVNQSDSRALSRSIFGVGPIGNIPMGTVILLGVGVLLIRKFWK